MIAQRVPCLCCLLESHSKNENQEREEFKKHGIAQKAVGQIKSNSTVVLLVLIELHQGTNTQMFH